MILLPARIARERTPAGRFRSLRLTAMEKLWRGAAAAAPGAPRRALVRLVALISSVVKVLLTAAEKLGGGFFLAGKV